MPICQQRVAWAVAVPDGSLYIAFQDRKQLPQFLPGFGRVLGRFNAMVQVGVNDFFREGFQSFSGGNKLHENLRAIAVLVNHRLDGCQLPRDPTDPVAESFAFIVGMTVVFHEQEYWGLRLGYAIKPDCQ